MYLGKGQRPALLAVGTRAGAVAGGDGPAHLATALADSRQYGRSGREERDALAAASSTLFVVAAGNNGSDNDATPEYPCNYDLANVVCVAASDRDDSLPSSPTTARRVSTSRRRASTSSAPWPGGRIRRCSTARRWRRRTSAARPHCCWPTTAGLTVAGLRAALLGGAHPVAALAGRVASGGRLDVAAALSTHPAPPEPPVVPPPAVAVAAPTTAASTVDRTAPGVSLRIDPGRLRGVRTRGLRLEFGASEACRAGIDVRIDARSARRLHLGSRTIGRASASLAKAGSRTVTVRLSARAARALRLASRLRVVAHVVAVDAPRATAAPPSGPRR